MKTTRRASGFYLAGLSLVELVIVVALLAVLVTMGTAGYIESIKIVRREDATTFMQRILGEQALYYANFGGSYTTVVADLGHGSFENNDGQTLSGDEHYLIALSVCPAGDGALPLQECVRVTASAWSQSQRKDAQCQTFTIDSLGRRAAFDADGEGSDGCWK